MSWKSIPRFWTISRKVILIMFVVSIFMLVSDIWLSYRRDDIYYSPLSNTMKSWQKTTSAPELKQSLDELGPTSVSFSEHELIQIFQNKSGIVDVRDGDYHSTNYDNIFGHHHLEGVLARLDFQQRCSLYFNNLYANNSEWRIDPDANLPVEHRFSDNWDDFRRDVMGDAKKAYSVLKGIPEDQIDEVSSEFEDTIRTRYKDFKTNNQRIEQQVVDYISHLRIFNKCFITSDDGLQLNANKKFLDEQKKVVKEFARKKKQDSLFDFKNSEMEQKIVTSGGFSCEYLQSRIYPWLANSEPTYERWDGTKLLSVPNMKEYVSDERVFTPTNLDAHESRGVLRKSKFPSLDGCFFRKFKNSLNGKGIVMSIGDQHVPEAVKLIQLLRAMGNVYPIEIVYYDSLSKHSRDSLVKAATKPMKQLETFQQVKDLYPLDLRDASIPQQELWFVNTYNVVLPSHRSKFDKFGNKFLATLFNSFEEYILLDADAVLLKHPDYFFEHKGYKDKGALFYKDRTAAEFRPKSDSVLLKKLSPSLIDSALFNIPIMTNYTIGRSLFDGMSHYMESGLVVIDRNMHFNTMLMIVQLNFMKPVTERLYGDKEMFFLSFAADGDESYHFNKFFTAAVGDTTPQEYRRRLDGSPLKSMELCSCHPGHLSELDDGKSLDWINSGFRFCGKADEVNYEEEFANHRRLPHIDSKERLEQLFKNPLNLRSAIIPPFTRKTDTLRDNISEEPKEGWLMDKGYCKSYLWCAYSSIGGQTSEGGDNTLEGSVFNFNETFSALSDYYGQVWNADVFP